MQRNRSRACKALEEALETFPGSCAPAVLQRIGEKASRFSTLYHPYFYPLRYRKKQEIAENGRKKMLILLDKSAHRRNRKDVPGWEIHNSNP